MRIPTTTRISELWPRVARITIEAHQTYRSAFGVFEKDMHGHYVPNHTAEFLFECRNNDCTVGYFDLGPVVSSMCAHNETYREGTMECRGNEAKDHNNRCPCRLEYRVTVDYTGPDDGANLDIETTENSV